MIPRKCESRFFASDLDGELVLLHADTGHFHSVKGVALSVWNAIDGIRTLADIQALMAERYAVAPAICAAEVAAFVDELHAAGFIDMAT